MRFFVLVCLLLASRGAAARPQGPLPPLQSGDVVLQTSRSSQSRPIQQATHSPYSHVGLVEVRPGGVFVLEAVQPVRRTPLAAWRARGEGGRLTVLRHPGLTPAAARAVVAEAARFLGRPYDRGFGWGDEALYCSELVAKAYARGAGLQVGRMEPLGSLDLAGLEPLLKRRYGGRVPREHALLTPASLAQDAAFRVVYSDVPGGRQVGR